MLSTLVAVFLIFASAMGKFTEWEGKTEMFAHMGWTEKVLFNVGILEVAITILFLIPRTSFLGAILLTAYLGGAVGVHVRIEEPSFFPVVLGVIVWVALGLRQPVIFRLAFGSPLTNPTAGSTSSAN
ncbi:hypothetical protein Q31a_40590 [Aureliella helgolandensis]|uniref:DoxX n=1 Tax=Aureliella helgolandensis TaxID=2527968 RepID=A0A518GAV4_9BACT|nr:hypothetical protein Q31a_40590 [Aureliella helgolandensis]